MATKAPRRRTFADFPDVAQEERRLHELQGQLNTGVERRNALWTEYAHAPTKDSAIEAHIGALVSGADTPDTLDLDARKQLGERVAEQEQKVHIIKRAIERQEQRASAARGEASGQILADVKTELLANERVKVLAMLRLMAVRDQALAFRRALDQEGVTGAMTAWTLPFSLVDTLGRLDEPDSQICRVLREAEGLGVFTPSEVAAIKGGRFPLDA